MFHSFLQLAVKRGASDVHFEVGYPPTYRVFGELLAAKVPPLTHADTEAIANFVLQAPAPVSGRSTSARWTGATRCPASPASAPASSGSAAPGAR